METATREMTAENQKIIDRIVRDERLSESQRVQLEKFSQIDDKCRMLAAVGNKYYGTESRLEELSQQRLKILEDKADPVLAKAIRDYEDQVEDALFEDGLNY